jgi:hypothetical protein
MMIVVAITLDLIFYNFFDRQVDRQTDIQTDRQTDRQTDSSPWLGREPGTLHLNLFIFSHFTVEFQPFNEAIAVYVHNVYLCLYRV